MTIIELDAKMPPHIRAKISPAVELVAADTIKPEAVRWLWAGWLARGKLHVLAGPPGTGKTTIALSLAATVSSGGRWPDSTRAPAGRVLIWSGEDDLADTLVPRLAAAGADLARVHFVGKVTDPDGRRSFDPATDVRALTEAAAELGDVALLIVDPIVSAISGDSHKNAETRRGLQPLVDLGRTLNAAVLGISHFSKGTAGRDPLERVTGSLAFGALARLVFAAAKDREGDGRLFLRVKCSVGPDDGGFRYDLALKGELQASVVDWGERLEGNARVLLDAAEAADDAPRTEAADWLERLLERGPSPVLAVKREAAGAGLSWRTVERAKTDLGVVARRISTGNVGGGFWEWSLPGNTATATPPSTFQDLAALSECSNGAGSSDPQGARPPTFESGGVADSEAVSEGDIPERFRSQGWPAKAEIEGIDL